MTEAMTDSDTYKITFNEGVQLAPQQKALMLTSLIQIDYMFFETDMCTCEDGKIKITLFECYCYGIICPCIVEYTKNNGGGGAAPSGEEMER